MLFSSYEFIFAFLPATILLFHAPFLRDRLQARIVVLLAASMTFYAWWDIRFLPVLLGSIVVNYRLGHAVARPAGQRESARSSARRRTILTIGIVFNLALLAFFKYCNFFIGTVNGITHADMPVLAIVLPLGISFFTFEQIAYIVDTYRHGDAERDPFRYALFVAFFPRLVAGPILRASEFLPQLPLLRGQDRRITADLAIGITLFAIGLFKKTFIADGISAYASPVFLAAARGGHPDLLLSWAGALAYTFQLYFDFSGYSDMAIGAARCFGIRFPLNFWSPYKSTSIIEFWRRWHMTLSRFLRDYLYISLGGNRRGMGRRYSNLIVTMLLGGLWHGANWTFVVWGGLHGLYLMINHAWLGLRRGSPRLDRLHGWRLVRAGSWLLTFVAVVVGWVFFRSPDFRTAASMLQGMAGLNGLVIPSGLAFLFGPLAAELSAIGITFDVGSGSVLLASYIWIFLLTALVLVAPNASELLARWQPTLDQPPGDTYGDIAARKWRLRWTPDMRWAVVTATLGVIGVLSIARGSEFLYWQF